ncbi:molecular chaperone HtpG [Pseudenhygromyxa sp. WMMC2535]|uniref:molecular chaperone HtpG n=1 Tax=Pseudenhygromyxa sp. WMMC2535 TaxID=2712867 RepID=UPI00155761C2|nr:molecular chaperone HtpG [Pseudenhygromyxa sp. WMMC2535]NVB40158.1 molecular chaperone HtpG [Pseudenhygromyxa sp. WMMC2535]
MSAEAHEFKAEVAALLKLVTNSLYTNSEIFLRELISNAADALDKARYQALIDASFAGKELEPQILITANKQTGKLIIEDTGVGMTHEEAARNLGTIAHSGTLQYLSEVQKARATGDLSEAGEINLIGQFGVGFYSAFMVADEVVVHSLSGKAGSEPIVWRSKGEGAYSLEPGTRSERGTTIELHLKEEAAEFLDRWRLQGLIKRYSNYVMHPIKIRVIDEQGEDKDPDPAQINAASAIWAKSPSDLEDGDYAEFYKHVMGGFVLPGDEPLGKLHFSADAPIQFHALLFVPGRAPADLFQEDRKSLQLYARRVLVMENCDTLLPQYLRFVRGVVDSEDLPLNVSRETLQENKQLAAIRRQLTRKVLKLLAELAEEDAEAYAKLWTEFGSVIKEGVHLDGGQRKELIGLLRWRSVAKGDTLVSLAEYVAAMPEDQKSIWYIAGPDESALRNSPHLEAVRARGEDVLLMSDPVDEWVLQSLSEYEDKPFRSVTQGDLEEAAEDDAADENADEDSEDEAAKDEGKREPSPIDPLLNLAKVVLGDRVRDVRASKRLTESPSCLVDAAGGLSRNMQRILRMAQPGSKLEAAPRILELNPDHPFVKAASGLSEKNKDDLRLPEWIEILHDLAALSEGSVPDPAGAAKRFQKVLNEVASAAVEGAGG